MIPACRLCLFIRGFLITAFAVLLAMMFFADAFAQAGAVMPSPLTVALAVPASGIPAFIIRFKRWKSRHEGGVR